jgi:colanic acid/amylovoran biosynthesis protein
MHDANHPVIALLGATFDSPNLGVGALANGALKCIRDNRTYAHIVLLDYERSSVQSVRLAEGEVCVPVVNLRFSKRVYLRNNIALLLVLATALTWVPSRRIRRWLIDRNLALRSIEQIDLAAAISGGDSFSDIYGLGRLLYVSLPQILVLLLNKKLVLLPQTIGPFRGRLSKGIATYILRRADQVCSRDAAGLQVVADLIGRDATDRKCRFCYDLGFVLDPIPPDHLSVVGLSRTTQSAIPLVGLNVSGLLALGGYSRKNMFGLKIDYEKLIHRLIHHMIARNGVDVLLIPHVFGSDVKSESDEVICERVWHQLREKYEGRLGITRGSYNPSEIKYVIGQCDFVIGSRMHACIAAVSQCVPTACIAYSQKFIGVMEAVGVQASVADARRLSEDEILEVVQNSYDLRHDIRNELKVTVAVVKASILNVLDSAVERDRTEDSHYDWYSKRGHVT